jgi:sulfoxide reductase heme-binding subunit YedZ
MVKTRHRNIFKPLVFLGSLAPLCWLAYAIYSDTVFGTRLMTADPIQKLDRELGDWALIFIILSLSVRPLARLFKNNEVIAYRRMVGLFAFFYVCLHLTSYIGLNLQFDFNEFKQDIFKRNFITIGIIGFILLIPLAVTSTKSAIKWLGGRRWKKLHSLIYPIALLGTLHFFMMVRADFSRPSMYMIVILALFGCRFWFKYTKANSLVQVKVH